MRYFFSFVLLLTLHAEAQLKSFIIGQRGDTLNRVDAKGLKQGPWSIHVDALRSEPGYEAEGYFVNDKKEGRWVQYSLQGDKIAIENYRWGQKDGRCQYFNNAEDLIREESWLAVDPKNPYDTIPIYDLKDPTKITQYRVVKMTEASVKHGTWRYYSPLTGAVEKTEEYVFNRLKGAPEEGSEELAPIDPKTGRPMVKVVDDVKPKTKPKEVMDFEKKNSGKKKVKLRDGNTGG